MRAKIVCFGEWRFTRFRSVWCPLTFEKVRGRCAQSPSSSIVTASKAHDVPAGNGRGGFCGSVPFRVSTGFAVLDCFPCVTELTSTGIGGIMGTNFFASSAWSSSTFFAVSAVSCSLVFFFTVAAAFLAFFVIVSLCSGPCVPPPRCAPEAPRPRPTLSSAVLFATDPEDVGASGIFRRSIRVLIWAAFKTDRIITNIASQTSFV